MSHARLTSCFAPHTPHPSFSWHLGHQHFPGWNFFLTHPDSSPSLTHVSHRCSHPPATRVGSFLTCPNCLFLQPCCIKSGTLLFRGRGIVMDFSFVITITLLTRCVQRLSHLLITARRMRAMIFAFRACLPRAVRTSTYDGFHVAHLTFFLVFWQLIIGGINETATLIDDLFLVKRVLLQHTI